MFVCVTVGVNGFIFRNTTKVTKTFSWTIYTQMLFTLMHMMKREYDSSQQVDLCLLSCGVTMRHSGHSCRLSHQANKKKLGHVPDQANVKLFFFLFEGFRHSDPLPDLLFCLVCKSALIGTLKQELFPQHDCDICKNS